jgi:hypothetical protein
MYDEIKLITVQDILADARDYAECVFMAAASAALAYDADV